MDRYQHFLTDRNYDIVEALRRFAAARDMAPAAVALGWLLAQPTVPSVTPGATRPEQVAANAAAADWQPTAEDLALLRRDVHDVLGRECAGGSG